MKHRPGTRVERYSKMRRVLETTLRTVQRIPTIHGLVEYDVTDARARIAAHRRATGQTLSFTAFIVACVARAVADYRRFTPLGSAITGC